ncbi:E3 ubiquitin-protein ligase HERC2-like isoform X3 [Macaca nemestrina]|uniref:E3 ubiquitin-protein ligase HERC2-like isoform X3 n=1 Tax=Macaca nemestrina TaxID=9545 RepID=UPI0039B8A60E
MAGCTHRPTIVPHWPLEEPKVISAFSGKQAGKHVVHIACGSTYSAAITAEGELYTGSRGNYGRLGHGQVWSWGDDDCGKSGRGASDGCKTPKLIEKLQDLDVVRVRCGSQFSIALTKDDQVYSWGKGDNQRRGHGPEGHVRYPKLLKGLRGKKVIDAAAGSTHCLALTEDIEVHSSGSNDQCQHFDILRVTKPEPAALPGLDTKHTVGIACGPAQDIEAQKEAQKGKEVDEQEANASTFPTSRTPLDKDLVNTGICESSANGVYLWFSSYNSFLELYILLCKVIFLFETKVLVKYW